jgi:hypothetical protein
MLRSGRWLAALVLIATAVAIALALQAPATAPEAAAATPTGSAESLDLGDHEAAGGHTLARHVGRSDEDLARRLRREPNLAAASTFLDRASAERAVAAALAAERGLVEAWAARGGRSTLALRWRGADAVVGRVLERGASAPVPARGARVVLRRRGDDWFVLTAYPEVR